MSMASHLCKLAMAGDDDGRIEVIDDALRADPFQPLFVDEGSCATSEPLAADTRGDAFDRTRPRLPPAWAVMAISIGRSGSLVGTRSQRRRFGRLTVMATGVSAVALSCCLSRPYRLIYNASSSVPIGFYRTDGRYAARRGALMLVALPEPWRQLAATRGYLPFGVLALKRVVGGPGDVVCGYGVRVYLNGHLVATRARRDAAGRSMPYWTGCARLSRDQWFLLNPAARSFDSRYIGPVPGAALRAEIVPL
jgi:conjugative transfer signal peptidase TraF